MKLFSYKQVSNFSCLRLGGRGARSALDPSSICLYVSDKCNLNCIWCLRATQTLEPRADMDVAVAERAVNTFPRAVSLSLAGFGEPLLNKDLFAIARRFARRPMLVSVITNGTLLLQRKEEFGQALFHRVSVSLNADNADDYKRVIGRSASSFDEVIEGIRMLRNIARPKRPLIDVSYVLTGRNLSRMESVIRIGEELQIDNLLFHNLIAFDSISKAEKTAADFLHNKDPEAVEAFSKIRARNWKVRVRLPRLVDLFLQRPARICSFHWNWVGIDVAGNVAGCGRAMEPRTDYGNIFTEGREAWNNEFRTRMRGNFIRGEWPETACCRTCAEVQA